jgi:hypothetical protein
MTPRGGILLQTVDNLIDPYTNKWDELLIRENFLAVDAECILRIPLSEYQNDDFIAWHKSKNFIFSVQSAYYVEWEHQFGARVRRDGQGSSLVNPVWENLWKRHVPGKVKFFLWRALHGFVLGMAIRLFWLRDILRSTPNVRFVFKVWRI